MGIWSKTLVGTYGALTLGTLALGVFQVLGLPTDETREVSRLIFIHLPTAFIALGGALAVFIASIGFLGWRTERWDRLAHAAAEVTVVNATVLLLTGIVWAKAAWGQWWIVSPRLTFSFVLWLLFMGYLVVRARIPEGERRGTICAVYGVIAFLDVPLLYLSVKLLPDKHPISSGLTHATAATLAIWCVGLGLLAIGTIAMAMMSGRSMNRSISDGGTGGGVGVGPSARTHSGRGALAR